MTRVFSFIFFFISVWFGLSSILSHIVFVYNFNYFYYYIIWIGCFVVSLLLFLKPIVSMRQVFRDRVSTSISWPFLIKLINGLTWALPFLLIPFFPKYYPFLLLTGLSLGNISTFIFLKKYSKIFSIEQLITGSLLLSSLLIVTIYYNFTDHYEIILFFTRVMISISYGIGGLVGYFKNTDDNATAVSSSSLH
jgi:hypothetical protein